MTHTAAVAGDDGDPWRLVPALGIAQIISWGALYYAIGVLGGAIGADLGLSPANVFGAYSAGLLLSAFAAPAVGRAIDRHGGRIVLTVGSIVAAAALFWLSRVGSLAEYYAAWCLAGIAMALTLYDPAFATLSQNFGLTYRRALTALTLFGGFASTVFWPLAQFGLAHIGWRDTLAAFAGLEIVVCLPLHWFLTPAGRGHEPPATAVASAEGARPAAASTSPQFIALALSFSLNAFVVSAVAAHVVGLLQGGGMAAGEVVWIAALIGPMQVTGRILEITLGRNLRAVTVGIVALSLLIVALGLLLAGAASAVAAAIVFAMLYGVSNGVMTIVRGTVPAEFFGRAAYGSLLGRLAAPSHVARAAGPVALAAFAAPQAAPQAALLFLLAIASLSFAAFIVTVRVARRHSRA